jgi:hypothetical protein
LGSEWYGLLLINRNNVLVRYLCLGRNLGENASAYSFAIFVYLIGLEESFTCYTLTLDYTHRCKVLIWNKVWKKGCLTLSDSCPVTGKSRCLGSNCIEIFVKLDQTHEILRHCWSTWLCLVFDWRALIDYDLVGIYVYCLARFYWSITRWLLPNVHFLF